MKRIRIAVTGLRGIPALWGGVERQCEEVYVRLAKQGFDVCVFARKNYVSHPVKIYKGVRIISLATLEKKGLEAFFHTFVSVMKAMIINPDILHFYTQGPCLFSWIPRVLRPKMRIFFTCQGLDWQRRKWSRAQSFVIRVGELFSAFFPHKRIVVSRALQEYYLKRYRVKTEYIPNGVDIPERVPLSSMHRLGIEKGKYFLCVGRLVPEKRFEDIISAYLKSKAGFKLVVVGDSSATDHYVNRLKSMASHNKNVIFTGYRYGNELAELFSNAAAFATASELEGLPLTLLEACSYGLPCIASSIPPHREVLGDIEAFWFEVGDLKTLSESLENAEKMTDDKVKKVGEEAVLRVKKYYSWDHVAEKIASLYLAETVK